MKKYKEFELILSSFRCDKNCPYCTAKITKWPVVEDNLEILETKFKEIQAKDIKFQYFIMCGNGEPSLISIDNLKTIMNAINKYDMFDEFRFQSSGNIFYEQDKFHLVKDKFLIEITRVDFNSKIDMEVLGYKRDYINTNNFKEANIRLNYVLMKNKSFEKYLEEIKKYIDTYPNIKTISLKTLNLNTKSEDYDNPYSKWILEHALTKSDTDEIIEYMNKNALFSVKDEKFFDRYEWVYKGVPITFYIKKLEYGFSNIVYYGGKLVNYKLKEVEI